MWTDGSEDYLRHATSDRLECRSEVQDEQEHMKVWGSHRQTWGPNLQSSADVIQAVANASDQLHTDTTCYFYIHTMQKYREPLNRLLVFPSMQAEVSIYSLECSSRSSIKSSLICIEPQLETEAEYGSNGERNIVSSANLPRATRYH